MLGPDSDSDSGGESPGSESDRGHSSRSPARASGRTARRNLSTGTLRSSQPEAGEPEFQVAGLGHGPRAGKVQCQHSLDPGLLGRIMIAACQ